MKTLVLILVLVEIGLGVFAVADGHIFLEKVLILVLVEIGLGGVLEKEWCQSLAES